MCVRACVCVCEVLTKQHPCQLQDHKQFSTTLHVYIVTRSTLFCYLFDKINCANSVHSLYYVHAVGVCLGMKMCSDDRGQ